MNRLHRFLIVIAVLGFFAGAAYVYQYSGQLVSTSADPLHGLQTLNFNKSIMVTADSLGVDDGELNVVPCENDPQIIGYIEITPQLAGELSCSTDYLGGVNLTFTGPMGDKETVSLAQQDGDAGDMWDTRSLITRTSDGLVLIEMISLSSSESLGEDNDQPASCSVRQESLIWDLQAKAFAPAEGPGEFFLSRFIPPINVVNDCLDSNGLWRGGSR